VPNVNYRSSGGIVRYAARVDANHSEVRKALEQIGCTVCDLSGVGGGVNDLLVGYRGRNILVEVKDGEKPPSARKLTPAQVSFRAEWRGQYGIAKNVNEAIEIVQRETLR